MVTLLNRAVQPDPASLHIDILDRDDRISTFRDHGSRHNPDGRSRLDGYRFGRSRGNLSGNRQFRTGSRLCGADRESVHCRVVVTRQITLRDQVLRQDPARGII